MWLCILVDSNVHFVVKDLRFTSLCRWNQMCLENLQDVFANLGEFGLNLLAIFFDQAHLRFVAFRLLLLLNRGDDPPGSTSRANDVLVRDGKEIPLFN